LAHSTQPKHLKEKIQLGRGKCNDLGQDTEILTDENVVPDKIFQSLRFWLNVVAWSKLARGTENDHFETFEKVCRIATFGAHLRLAKILHLGYIPAANVNIE
jgi:hypothetical protein